MKQYRITSADYVLPGETGDADAVMDSTDLNQIRKLAGLVTEAEAGMYTGQNTTPQAGEGGIVSPVGSNISWTASERRALEHEYGAQPGTDLWFIINFTKPYLNGSLRQHVEDYLKKHPEYRLKPHPGD
jgi:hypothetical protein